MGPVDPAFEQYLALRSEEIRLNGEDPEEALLFPGGKERARLAVLGASYSMICMLV